MSKKKNEKSPLTVRKLIELLQAVENQDMLVDVEGCDCEAPAYGIEVSAEGVLVRRE